LRLGGKMSDDGWLRIATNVYFWFAGIAAAATAIAVLAGIAQNRLNVGITDRKDREFAEFRVSSETLVARLQTEAARLSAAAETAKLENTRHKQRCSPAWLSSAIAMEMKR
jgi:hypothetical protein